MLRRIQALPWIHTAYDVALALLTAFITPRYVQEYDLLIGWSMALALVFRRRRPMTVMAVVSGLALVQYVLAEYPDFTLATNPAVYDVALLIAMVSVVTHARQMWHVYVAGAVVLAGITVESGLGLPGSRGGWDPNVDLIALVAYSGLGAALWLTALVLRTRRLYVATLEARAAAAEREREHLVQIAAAEERAEIARELHDVVAHSLAVMILQADGAGYVLTSDPDKAGTALKAIGDTGRDALEDMHRIVRVLRGGRGPGQDPEGDRRRVSLEDLETVAERARAAGLRVDLAVEGERGGLSTAVELTVLRIVQESLTNVLRHAGPGAQVEITLRIGEDAVLIGVVDDGAGKLAGSAAVAAAERRSGGNGLVGMRERVEVSGGSFTAGPRMGAGWQVDAEIPRQERQERQEDPVGTAGRAG